MDKKSGSYENKIKYNIEYNKNNYKQMKFNFKPEFVDSIERFCTAHNMNKTDLVKTAVEEYMEEHEFD